MMVQAFFQKLFSGKRVAILGFGREGQSTHRLLSRLVPDAHLIICDRNPDTVLPDDDDKEAAAADLRIGPDYLTDIATADFIIKSPGIPFTVIEGIELRGVITSQTELFLSLFRKQVIGITGTKGKSTTASLLFHMLQEGGKDVVLLGNIGVPCFDRIDLIREDTLIVFEMSSHQLEGLQVSPSTAILLNIFEEHLDHYASYEDYQQAKLNILRWQEPGDICIWNPANKLLGELVSRLDLSSKTVSLGRHAGFASHGEVFFDGDDLVFRMEDQQQMISGAASRRKLSGAHNLENISAAAAAAFLHGVDADVIAAAIGSFAGLPHRLEYAGSKNGVIFYNDSIATIPEATLAALRALPDTVTLLLGGRDRGVKLEAMLEALAASGVINFVFTGDAGERMKGLAEKMPAFENKYLYMADSFDAAVMHAAEITPPGRICLLSPAATSYDAFPNFEARGNRFKELIRAMIKRTPQSQ